MEIIQVDLAVIGAGIYGIQAARTYLEIHSDHRVVILEASRSVGGVWSAERMYDEFYTQTPLGILEFSDLPMHDVPEEDQYFGFFAARHVTRYLENYMKTREYSGLTLLDRVYFDASVDSLERLGKSYRLRVNSRNIEFNSPRVLDCTGMTSIPNLPDIAGMSAFRGDVIHHKEFGSSAILESQQIHSVAVVGGAKSAGDVVYAAAKAGKAVSWIIRASGAGPAAFLSPKGQWPYRNSNESFYTRATGYFLASLWAPDGWLSAFLHRTSLGQALFGRVWDQVDRKTSRFADYERGDGRNNGFYNLKRDTSVFWTNESPGINQREDFFDVVAKTVRVFRQDIRCMDETDMVLADGTTIRADAVVFATGWKVTHPHIDPGLARELGLAIHLEKNNDEWGSLDSEATTYIHDRFPHLSNKPHHHELRSQLEPFRLYNSIVPVKDSNILFLGKMMLGNHFRNAEVQALFAVAVLDGTLQLPKEKSMKVEIAKTVSWCRERNGTIESS